MRRSPAARDPGRGRRWRRSSPWPPDPPVEMPPARTVWVPGRGEFFLRDTGGDGPAVMLLHGWMASADLNWNGAYGVLAQAGYRVLAIDHRGHGRGLRPLVPFTLEDCAADAVAVLEALEAAPALVVGYSMGGAIAQLLARNHPEAVSGLVLSGTAQHWQDEPTQRAFKALGMLGVSLSVAPRATWRAFFLRARIPQSPRTAWVQSELMRHFARDLVEAGRELGRFDSRPWLPSLTVPVSVVLTTHDELVPPYKQRELAKAAGAQVFEVAVKHLELTWRHEEYNPALLAALEAVRAREPARA